MPALRSLDSLLSARYLRDWEFTIRTQYEADYLHHYFYPARTAIGTTLRPLEFVFTSDRFLAWTRTLPPGGYQVLEEFPFTRSARQAAGIESSTERRDRLLRQHAPRPLPHKASVTPLPLP